MTIMTLMNLTLIRLTLNDVFEGTHIELVSHVNKTSVDVLHDLIKSLQNWLVFFPAHQGDLLFDSVFLRQVVDYINN